MFEKLLKISEPKNICFWLPKKHDNFSSNMRTKMLETKPTEWEN